MSGKPAVDTLLQAEPSEEVGRGLLDWATETIDGIARGEAEAGILTLADIEKVPLALARAGECGQTAAWLRLAWWKAMPSIGMPDSDAAEAAIRRALAAGAEHAKVEAIKIRWFFRREEATEDERRETLAFAREMAEQEGNPDGWHYLGLLTCQGFGTPADPAAAFALQRRAADLGCADAMFELYTHHVRGLGTPQNDEAAFAANLRAAEVGHARAAYNLGAFYATGWCVPQDMRKAAEWYEKASAAGNARATATLALLYATGEGVEKNRAKAEQLFAEAEFMGLDCGKFRALAEM